VETSVAPFRARRGAGCRRPEDAPHLEVTASRRGRGDFLMEARGRRQAPVEASFHRSPFPLRRGPDDPSRSFLPEASCPRPCRPLLRGRGLRRPDGRGRSRADRHRRGPRSTPDGRTRQRQSPSQLAAVERRRLHGRLVHHQRGQECAWPVTEDVCIAFNPAGSCVTPLALACNAVEEVTGCGCNGQNVTWSSGCVGLPSGWAPIGLAHAGACEAPVPPTPVDASGPTPIVTECQTGSDCGAGSVCLNTDPLQTPSGTCVANPCGSETLSCGCAASLCTSIGPCDISSPGTVECLSEG